MLKRSTNVQPDKPTFCQESKWCEPPMYPWLRGLEDWQIICFTLSSNIPPDLKWTRGQLNLWSVWLLRVMWSLVGIKTTLQTGNQTQLYLFWPQSRHFVMVSVQTFHKRLHCPLLEGMYMCVPLHMTVYISVCIYVFVPICVCPDVSDRPCVCLCVCAGMCVCTHL
jgi:hypothetical protein